MHLQIQETQVTAQLTSPSIQQFGFLLHTQRVSVSRERWELAGTNIKEARINERQTRFR